VDDDDSDVTVELVTETAYSDDDCAHKHEGTKKQNSCLYICMRTNAPKIIFKKYLNYEKTIYDHMLAYIIL